MIKSVKGLVTRRFIETGKSKFSGLDEGLARQRLMELNAATSRDDFGRLNSVARHELKGHLRGYWSIDVNGPWRILFRFENGNAREVHIHDPQ